MNAIPGTTYTIFIKGAHHIQKRLCQNNPSEDLAGKYDCQAGQITLRRGQNVLDLSRIILLAGDLGNQDGVVDSVDVVGVRQRIGSRKAEDLDFADLNQDGIVDTQDFSLVLYSLNFKFDEK